MGLLTYDPRRLVAGLLGMGATGDRGRSTRASGREPAMPTATHSAPFAGGVRTMGFPTAPFPSRLGRKSSATAPRHHERGERPHMAQPVAQPAKADVAPLTLPVGVNWDFVRRWENKALEPETTGYVPPDPQRNSGVTIASGLDLGQHNEEDLKRIGIPDRLVNKMKPFLGLRGEAAKKEANRLRISEAEAAEIDRNMFAHTYRETAKRYNEAAAPELSFEDLPIEARTAIVSVSHQYGNNLAVNTPKFWSHVTNGRWGDAEAELRDFRDSHAPRRESEAELLATAIKAGALPDRQGQRLADRSHRNR